MASNSAETGAVTGGDTPSFALFSPLPFSRRNGRNWRNCWGLRRNPIGPVTPATPVTPVSAIASPRIVRRRRAARSALMCAPVEDRRSDDENALATFRRSCAPVGSHRSARRKMPASQSVRATNLGSSPAQISPRHVSDGMSHSRSEPSPLRQPARFGTARASTLSNGSNRYSPCASMNRRTCSTACRASAGSVPPRWPIHCSSAQAAAAVASPSRQGVTPNRVASSPAAAIKPSRCAARSTWPSAPAGT